VVVTTAVGIIIILALVVWRRLRALRKEAAKEAAADGKAGASRKTS
jgi:hypothetical protein